MQNYILPNSFERILQAIAPIICFDIGARGGPSADFHALRSAVDLYGFEPDSQECERLNQQYSMEKHGFRSVRFVPHALAGNRGARTLHLTRHRGTSSLLKPIPEKGRQFSREQYTEVEKTVNIETITLDDFIRQEQLPALDMIKIDVEGLELEILASAAEVLAATTLAIRTEVAFLPIRENQPSYGELELFLKKLGFMPMGFMELHYWRQLSPLRPVEKSATSPFYSRGQLAHGDMVFLKSPDALANANSSERLKAALIAMCYGYFDYATVLLGDPTLSAQINNQFQLVISKEIEKAAKLYWKRSTPLKFHDFSCK